MSSMFSFFDPHGPTKQMWRMKSKTKREALARDRQDASVHAAGQFLRHIPIPEKSCIALYFPIGSELDTAPLAKELRDRFAGSVTLALPVVTRKNKPLSFRTWQHGAPLETGRYQTKVPPEAQSSPCRPDIILVPLLAFTASGGRLGYGGGYYDRTLALLREEGPDITAVGFGYGDQRVDQLPITPLDQPLDWMITERDALRFP